MERITVYEDLRDRLEGMYPDIPYEENRVRVRVGADQTNLLDLVIPVEGSLEGINVYIESDTQVNEGDPKENYHLVINPWLYEGMDVDRVKHVVEELLKAFPTAIVFPSDDTTVDFNEYTMYNRKVDAYTIIGTMSQFYAMLEEYRKENDVDERNTEWLNQLERDACTAMREIREKKQEYAQLQIDMECEAGQAGEDWNDDDGNRYGEQFNTIDTQIEVLKEELAKIESAIINF